MNSNEGECTTPNRPWMFGKVNAKQWILIRPDCKLWKCPHCAEKMARIWVVRIRKAGELWHKQELPVRFVTITSHRKLKTKDATIKVLPLAWNKLQARIRRANSCDFQYVLVPEQHQDGRVHMHMLATTALSTRWFKDACASCGFGYQVDSDPVEVQDNAAGYVAKYLFKMAKDVWPDGFRRVRTSQNFPEIDPHTDNDDFLIEQWICAPTPDRFQDTINALRQQGAKLINRQTGEIII